MLDYNDIIKDDHPNLRLKSEPVKLPLNAEDRQTLNKLNDYLVSSLDPIYCEQNNIRPGVGLAAPQINVQKQMFVILAENEKGELFHYGVINPKIISHSVELTFLPTGEGCLSVDRTVEGLVHRYRRITVKAHLYDFETNTISQQQIRLQDYLSIVFQHEFDHLNGILFYDHINKEKPFFIPENSRAIKFHFEDNNES